MSLWKANKTLCLLSERRVESYLLPCKEGIPIFRAAGLHEQKMLSCEGECQRCPHQECDQKHTAKDETGWTEQSLTRPPQRHDIT